MRTSTFSIIRETIRVAAAGSMASSASARPLPSRWVLPYPRPRNDRVGATNRGTGETKRQKSIVWRGLEPRGESTTGSRSCQAGTAIGRALPGRIVGRWQEGPKPVEARIRILDPTRWLEYGRSTKEAAVSRGFASMFIHGGR